MPKKQTHYETASVELDESCEIAGFRVHKHKIVKDLHGGLDRVRTYAKVSESRDVEILCRYDDTASKTFETLLRNGIREIYYDGDSIKVRNVKYNDVLNALAAAKLLNKADHARASEYLEEEKTR